MALQKIPGRAIRLDSQTVSDVMYYDGTDWVRLAKGEAGEVLTVNAAGTLPQWNRGWKFGGGSGGYASGGYPERPNEGVFQSSIQKFSFSNTVSAATVANLLTTKQTWGGSSSTTHGYCCGGYTGSPIAVTDTINKFAYASNTTAADHGNLHTGVRWPAGHQV